MSDISKIKDAARQRKSELEHFGMPGSFQIDPQIVLDLIADWERLSWLDKQCDQVTENHTYHSPEGELSAYRWVVEEPCGDIRAAIDAYCARMQP